MSTDRFPRWALVAFILVLPLHNLVMAELWDAGVRGFALDVVSAWKEVLLAAALALLVWRRRGVPFKANWVDWLALAYTAIVVLYALIPQDWLGGDASARGILYGVRHDLTPVACYFLGRSIALSARDRRIAGGLILCVAAVVAAWGLVDIYAVSLQTWRDSGVPGWFREQLGLEYRGLSGLPENWVYNPGDERPLRRLVSTFLSPLATAYLLLAAILVAATWRRDSRWLPWLTALLAIGLLFTYSRTTIAALAVGLRRARLRAPELVARRRRRGLHRGGVLLRPRLSGHRARDPLHGRRARDPARGRAGGADEREPARPRRVVDRQPPGQPPRRHPDASWIIRGATASATPA